MTRRWRIAKALAYVGAFLGMIFALYQLYLADQGLVRSQVRVGQIPVEVFTPQRIVGRRPAVVIAHGFAVSRQYLYPFAYTFARNGYISALFDFSGHGKNAQPFPSDWSAVHREEGQLTRELEQVLSYVRELPMVDRDRLALLGYSMGAGVIMRYARDHEEAQATIAVSTVFSDVLPAQPRNLLLLVGAWEGSLMQRVSRSALASSAGGSEEAQAGDFATGTMGRLVIVPNAEHVSMPFNPRTLSEALSWLDLAFGEKGSGKVDGRIVWIGLFYICAAILFGFFSRALLSGPLGRGAILRAFAPEGAPLELTGVLLVAGVPALVAPFLLALLHVELLPLAVGGYLATFLWIQGMLMLILLFALRSLNGTELSSLLSWRAVLAALLLSLYCVATCGLLTEFTLLSVFPIPRRLPILAAAFLIVAPYFVASEYVSRSHCQRADLLPPALVKGFLVASLGLGVALGGPSVLLLFLPGIALLVAGTGLLARRVCALTGNPGVGGLFVAMIFAWLLSVVFPIL